MDNVKITKVEIWRSANFETPRTCQILLFLCGPKYEVFWVKIFHISRIYHLSTSRILFQFF
jgi:hypothetical protein